MPAFRVAGAPGRAGRRRRTAPGAARRRAPARATPRSPSGCAAGPCSRARRGPRPCRAPSPMICTSTWRAPSTSRSRKTVASPKAFERLGARARRRPRRAPRRRARAGCRDRRRRPSPSPSAGSRAARRAARVLEVSSTGPPLHGATGTPACLGHALRADLVAEPPHHLRARADEDDAEPLRHSSANSACSATKPQPTHAASARVAVSARSSAGVVEVARLPRPSRRIDDRSPSRGNAPRRPRARRARAIGIRVERDRHQLGRRARDSARARRGSARIAASPRFTIAMRSKSARPSLLRSAAPQRSAERLRNRARAAPPCS